MRIEVFHMSIINKRNIDTTIDDYKTIKVPSELLDFIKQKLGAEVLWVYDDKTRIVHGCFRWSWRRYVEKR